MSDSVTFDFLFFGYLSLFVFLIAAFCSLINLLYFFVIFNLFNLLFYPLSVLSKHFESCFSVFKGIYHLNQFCRLLQFLNFILFICVDVCFIFNAMHRVRLGFFLCLHNNIKGLESIYCTVISLFIVYSVN